MKTACLDAGGFLSVTDGSRAKRGEGSGVKPSMGSGAVGFLWELTQLYFNKRVSRAAAELAYFLVLSFFPFVIVLNAVVGTLPVDLLSVLEGADGVIPGEALGVIREYVGYITINQSRALLAAGIVMMLFSYASAIPQLAKQYAKGEK